MIVVFLLFFSDEGNTISEESSFSLTLFDSRNFEVAFTNTKEYIQIKLKKNKYFNVTLFLIDFGKYENYRYFNANTYEYVYIFRNNLTKLNVEFKFTRIGNFSDYYNFLIDYSGLKEDYKDETQDSQKLEEDETQNSSAAVIFATVLAYISFALIIFPIIIFYFICVAFVKILLMNAIYVIYAQFLKVELIAQNLKQYICLKENKFII